MKHFTIRDMSKTLEEQISGKCIHFNGLFINKECKKGVKYNAVKVPGVKPVQVPCLRDNTMSGGSCDFVCFPSDEEVKKQVEEIEQMTTRTIGAYAAVKNHFDKTSERQGKIECPECQGDLHFTVAELNNHIWAKCSNCKLSFIE